MLRNHPPANAAPVALRSSNKWTDIGLIFALLTFGVQQGCSVSGNPTNWAWGAAWFSLSAIGLGVGLWHHLPWRMRWRVPAIVLGLGIMVYSTVPLVVRQFKAEHNKVSWFKISLDNVLATDVRHGGTVFLPYQGINGPTLSPIHVISWFSIYNSAPYPVNLTSVSGQVLNGDKWEDLLPIPMANRELFFIGTDGKAIRCAPEGIPLEESAIPPVEAKRTLRGWAAFEFPPSYEGKNGILPPIRVFAVDEDTNSPSEIITNQSSHPLGIHLSGMKIFGAANVDISSYYRTLYSENGKKATQ